MNAGNVDESEHEMQRCTNFLERFEVYQKWFLKSILHLVYMHAKYNYVLLKFFFNFFFVADYSHLIKEDQEVILEIWEQNNCTGSFVAALSQWIFALLHGVSLNSE